MKKKVSETLTPAQLAELESLARLADDAIDTSDAPEVLDWSGAKRGIFYRPVKQQLTLRLDADVVTWFKTHTVSAKGYQTRINQALREYVHAQEDGSTSSTKPVDSRHSESGGTTLVHKPIKKESVRGAGPQYETAAADCLNRAVEIATSLNHRTLSSDHLMLALTLDPNARGLLERVGNLIAIRATAMQSLGRMDSSFQAGNHVPTPTPDFLKVVEIARRGAVTQDRSVAIRDLVNGLAKARDRFANARNIPTDASTLLKEVSTQVEELGQQIREAVQLQFSVALRKLDESLVEKLSKLGTKNTSIVDEDPKSDNPIVPTTEPLDNRQGDRT